MLAELGDVLSRRRFGFTKYQINEFLLIIVKGSILATIEECPRIIEKDPDDNVVHATALKGGAEYIISGDKHLLSLREFRGIRIVTVREMMETRARGVSPRSRTF